jgi:hypothetical protein
MTMTKRILTANRLIDGRVVYLRADRTWSVRDGDALLSDDGLDEHLEWAKRQTEEVVEPYVIEVELAGSRIKHLSARERIRAEGPEGVLARFGPIVVPQRAVG